jgi:poly-D-alanine transfer protein DltD
MKSIDNYSYESGVPLESENENIFSKYQILNFIHKKTEKEIHRRRRLNHFKEQEKRKKIRQASKRKTEEKMREELIKEAERIKMLPIPKQNRISL